MINEFWFEAVNVNCFKNTYKVVKELNLKLKTSENIIILGPNGSGKSSIIDLINRNIHPVVENKSLLKIFNKELINIWELRKRISTVNNEIKYRINPNLRVFDLLISGLYGKYCFVLNKSDRDVSIANKLIKEMNLINLVNKNFSYLSDGEKQIVIIARALINNPEILILDEPSSSLDYKSKFYLIDKIDELSKLNSKIICVTHDISMITEIYERIIMLKQGEIIADGSQSQVLNSENINKLFDINIEIIKNRGRWEVFRKSKSK